MNWTKMRCVTLISGEFVNIIMAFCVHVTFIPNDKIQCFIIVYAIGLSVTSNLHTLEVFANCIKCRS